MQIRLLKRKLAVALVIAAGVSTLYGCTDNSGTQQSRARAPGQQQAAVAGYVINGPLQGARVRVFRADGELLGETETDADGHYEIVIADVPPFRVTTEGGLLEGAPYEAQLATDCVATRECDITPLTTAITRLVDQYGFNTSDARALVSGRFGFDADPFLASVRDTPVPEGFALNDVRTYLDHGAALDTWVDSVVAWVAQQSAPPVGVISSDERRVSTAARPAT